MEWRGGNHIVPADYRDDNWTDECARCLRCDVASMSLTFDGLCGACDDELFPPHPDCDDDPLRPW